MLLNLLRIRVIVNGKNIYTIERNKVVVIPLANATSKIVATDGYHFTNPLEVACHQINTCCFKVVCAIDDNQLAVGVLLSVLFYAAGFTSDILIIKAISFIPVVYFLCVYYLRKGNFIQLEPAAHPY